MGRISEFFGNPGKRPGIRCQANLPLSKTQEDNICFTNEISKTDNHNDKKDMQRVSTSSLSDSSDDFDLNSFKIQYDGTFRYNKGLTGLQKGHMDRTLDWLVMFAGTFTVFICIWIILIIWIVLGIVYSAPFNWQVVMQDGQSIQCYVWDTLLMRQQLSSSHEQIMISCQLRSKLASFKKFFKIYTDRKVQQFEQTKVVDDGTNIKDEQLLNDIENNSQTVGQLPVANWYDRASNYVATILGSVPSMAIFWIGVFIWVGCGAIPQAGDNSPPFTGRNSGSNPQYKKFSNAWQMDINTAVAVSLLICTTFLQNVRARHDKFIAKVLLDILEKDEKIDLLLRLQINDYTTPHKVITVSEPKRTWLQKTIDWYADVIGTGIGVIVAVIVFGVWLSIGSLLHWGDDWWLIIGTYTGLVGFIDGFVLREVYYRSVKHEENNYAKVIDEDLEFMQQLGISIPRDIAGTEQKILRDKESLDYKISSFVNRLCSDQYSVVVGVLIVVGLICASSGMKWSTTGQLIANTPTMIIEEFFLIVLIQAHNWADSQRRIEMTTLLTHRCMIESHLTSHFAIMDK